MGGNELVGRKTSAAKLKEAMALSALRLFRQQGHVYVDLRRSGKRSIFCCIVCRCQCYGEIVLNDHLHGKCHAERLANAKKTLFGPDPWPFNDGLFFFYIPPEEEYGITATSQSGSGVGRDALQSGTSLVVRTGGSTRVVADGDEVDEMTCRLRREGNLSNGGPGNNGKGKSNSAVHETDSCLTINGALVNQRVVNLNAYIMGHGEIAYRVHETYLNRRISRIWCAWFGQGNSSEERRSMLPDCGFAIVTFSYSHYLGRTAGAVDLNPSLRPSPGEKRKNPSSDSEDSSHSLSSDCSHWPGAKKGTRQKLRKTNSGTTEKICDLCAQEMLPGKDVGTLLNSKTGKLACSSRNKTGAFHTFHVSCLIHWLLVCDSEIEHDKMNNVKPSRGRKSKAALKRISSIFCPECQGTGKYIRGNELETPAFSLHEVFVHKMKSINSHKSWMENPETLERCSTGLHFLSDSEVLQESIAAARLLRFYRCDV